MKNENYITEAKNEVNKITEAPVSDEYRAECEDIVKVALDLIGWCENDVLAKRKRMSLGLQIALTDFENLVANRDFPDTEIQAVYSSALDVIERIMRWYNKLRDLEMPAGLEDAANIFIAMNRAE